MLKCICVLMDVNRHTHKNKDQYRSWKNTVNLSHKTYVIRLETGAQEGDTWLSTFSTIFVCNMRSHMCVRNVEE